MEKIRQDFCNEAVELFEICNAAPGIGYTKRYCAAVREHLGWSWFSARGVQDKLGVNIFRAVPELFAEGGLFNVKFPSVNFSSDPKARAFIAAIRELKQQMIDEGVNMKVVREKPKPKEQPAKQERKKRVAKTVKTEAGTVDTETGELFPNSLDGLGLSQAALGAIVESEAPTMMVGEFTQETANEVPEIVYKTLGKEQPKKEKPEQPVFELPINQIIEDAIVDRLRGPGGFFEQIEKRVRAEMKSGRHATLNFKLKIW